MSRLARLATQFLKPAFTAFSRQRLPQLDGRAYLPGLETAVTVYRDAWGVPHIYAANRHDLFFAQGFIHAQDRLWQMDVNRRVANGQLAEILGEQGLPTDRLTRTLGFARLAAASLPQIDERHWRDVAAYSAGVNAYLQTGALPLEFTLLRYEPKAWRPVDTMALAHLQAWALTHGWAGELARAQLIAKIGPERAAAIEPIYSPDNPATLPDGVEFNRLGLDGMLTAMTGPFLNRGADGGGRGSNGWLVSPTRSASGGALLGNDVHLPIRIPSLWYANHLCLEPGGFHITGVSIPGAPFVLVGHNADIAWGVTLSYADTEDLFIEKLPVDGRDRYLFQGEWRPTTIIRETIPVKGQPDHVEEVVLTHHGPIISGHLGSRDLPAPPGDDTRHLLSMSSMALRSGRFFSGFAAINEAHDWDSFTAAVRDLETPALNISYADRQGNIGYWLTGAIPIRAKGSGLVPAPGWSGDYEWVGRVPFDEMPHALNPERGFLVNCNNKIIGDDYPHYLGQCWMNGYRAQRLEELLDEGRTTRDEGRTTNDEGRTAKDERVGRSSSVVGRWSLAAFRRFHFDFHSIPGLELRRRLADHTPAPGDAALAWQLLQGWDGWLGPESVGGAVYQVLLHKLSRAILEPVLGRPLLEQLLGGGPEPLLVPVTEFYGHWSTTLLRLLANGDSFWLPEREKLLNDCLAATAVTLRDLCGRDPANWQWGQLHQIRFSHPLSVQRPLDHVFDIGPFPIGGDTDTLGQTAILPGAPYENNAFSVSYWQLIDMSDLDSAEMMLTPGQSGQLGSPHYADLAAAWLRGDSLPMLWGKEAVIMAARHRLVLVRPLG
jgi:penicillin G amidase